MSYTTYKNVKVLSLSQEKVTRQNRPKEIADPAARRSNYSVSVARFSDLPASVAIADFKGKFQVGETVSVAVDDKWQLISLVNHTSGQDSSLSYFSMEFSEWFSILFFASIPAFLFYLIGQKASDTEKYHDYAMFIWAAGVLVVILILRGVNKQFIESKAALRELKQ